MSGNVGCYAGDTVPVVGQCSGYQDTCGQFYCANHTIDKLCARCGERKQKDQAIQQVYQDYLATAESLREPNVGTGGVIALLFAIFCMFTMSIIVVFGSFAISPWCGVVGLLLACGLMYLPFAMRKDVLQQHEKFLVQLEETDKAKPGFKEFYQVWKKERNQERLKAIAAVTLAVASAGAEIHQAHNQKQFRQDIREINETLKGQK